MKSYKVRLKVISPLHIGTGEVYEPTEFFIHPRERYLGVLDFEKFCAHLSHSELNQFKKLCLTASLEGLLRLYDFVDRVCLNLVQQGLNDFILRRITISQGLLEHYRQVKSLSGQRLKKEFNRFTINRTAFSPNDNQPIIPGSSVKGVLRMAVLNKRRIKARGASWRDYCRQDNPRRLPKCDSKRLESEILEYPKNRFQQDPFRLVKVSDFRPVGEVKTRIVYAVNRKKDGGRARGPYQILEVIEPGAVFEGEITFSEALPWHKLRNPERDGVKSPVSWQEILEALKVFYTKESEREFEEINNIGANPPVFPDTGFPLRIGRHSGAECVTIEGFRHILIRGSRRQNTYQDHATTLWLASEFAHVKNAYGLKPFGWTVLYEPDKEPQPPAKEKTRAESSKIDVSKLAKNPSFKLVVKKKA